MPVQPAFPRHKSGHILYGADYNPEQWPREVWDEDVKLMREAGVNVVSVGIFSWALLEVADDKWDFGWLDDAINLLHKNDIGVDLATATASPPPWLTMAHPEILPITKNGETQWQGGRQHWRPTSPIFRKYALRLVQKLAERYGTHPGVVAWHVNNELGCHNYYDYSDDAARAFRTWLKEKYGNVEKLNEIWGTAFWSQHYYHFDEILPPRFAGTFINPTQCLDFRRFSSDALKDHLIAEREVLHKFSPGIPVTTNFMISGAIANMDYGDWASEVDFVSNDHYVVHGADDRDELSFSASYTSAAADGKPWFLMEHSTSAVNWQQVNIPKAPGQLARDSLAHVAHGADAVCFFQWRQSRSGAEKYHSSMVPHAGANSQVYRDVVALGKHLQDLKEIAGSTHSPAPVAILLDADSWRVSEGDSRPSALLDYRREALDWFVALLNAGIRVDVVPAIGKWDHYQMVIGPILHVVDKGLKSRVEKYVHNGGNFVATYFSGIVDENDHVWLGGYPGAFRDLFGIRIEEFGPLRAGDSVELDGTSGTFWTDRIDVVDAKVLRKYTSGLYEGRPAITTRGAGKGSATYVSTKLGVRGLASVLPDILNIGKVSSTLPKSLRGKVEQVIRTNGKQAWEFLVSRGEESHSLEGLDGEVVVSSGGGKGLDPWGVAVLRRDVK